MVICNRLGSGCSNTLNAKIVSNTGCPDLFGCPSDVCPDFTIRRHDTLPAFKVSVEDCDGPLDLEGERIVCEANMWAKGRLKAKLALTDTTFALADNIGFYQININDIIALDRVRSPEYLLVTDIDETNKRVTVQRGYNGTRISEWPKGNSLRIFKMLNAPAVIEIVKQDQEQPDGTKTEDVLVDTFLVYNWTSNDTCLPGCYWLEFKVFKEIDLPVYDPTPSATPVTIGNETITTEDLILIQPSMTPGLSVVPSNIVPSEIRNACEQPGFEWVRRFPVDGEGFLIKITDSPTAERI